MSKVNTYIDDNFQDDREINGLFCEEVLRDWLQSLQQQLAEHGTANHKGPMDKISDSAHLSLVKDSGRGT